MAVNTPTTIVRENDVTEKFGILVDKHIADSTVWDKLAKENPTHAVISAGNEADAAAKSKDQIDELLAELQDGIVLDLGCGYGRIAKYLLPQRTFAGYVGMDSAYEMLTIFKERYLRTPAEQTTPAIFLNADIHTIPLHDATIENVIVAAVFLHNHKSVVRQSIEEVYRVVKPGGQVLVYSSFPNKWSLMGLQGAFYQMLLNVMGNPFKNGPVRYYGKREVAHLFEHFSEVSIRPYGFALLPKRLIFLPGVLDRLWRIGVANPINGMLETILPRAIANRFPSHYDVTAVR